MPILTLSEFLNHRMNEDPDEIQAQGGLLRPPIFPPRVIHLKHSSARNIITKTKPIITFPETMINLSSFYAQGILGEWSAITPGRMREILLQPDKVAPLFADLQMEMLDFPRMLIPAHVPSLSDVGFISKGLEVVLR